MQAEGELCVRLRVSADRVSQVHVDSTRPDVARALLQGRSLPEVHAAVPLLFSVCSRSQATASRLACAAAVGDDTGPAMLAHCAAAVTAESVREAAWRVLLDWPVLIGEKPAAEAVAAARASLSWGDVVWGGSRERPADDRDARRMAQRAAQRIAHQLAAAVFAVGADAWLALRSAAELDRWAGAGATAAARFIRALRDDAAAPSSQTTDTASFHCKNPQADDIRRPPPEGDKKTWGGPAFPCETALLDTRNPAAWIAEIADALDADPEFCRRPTWREAPAETGALARCASDPVVAELLHRPGPRILARYVARLLELASLLSGVGTAAVGARSLGRGAGIAWVENARGLLIHQVRQVGERVDAYRIVAPTEWNFHPCGALTAALLGAPARDLTALKQQAQRVVHSLDACVACRIEIEHA